MLRTVGTNQQAILTLYRGMPEQARYPYQRLLKDEAVSAYARGWSDWVVGMSHLWQGQVLPAQRCCAHR